MIVIFLTRWSTISIYRILRMLWTSYSRRCTKILLSFDNVSISEGHYGATYDQICFRKYSAYNLCRSYLDEKQEESKEYFLYETCWISMMLCSSRLRRRCLLWHWVCPRVWIILAMISVGAVFEYRCTDKSSEISQKYELVLSTMKCKIIRKG